MELVFGKKSINLLVLLCTLAYQPYLWADATVISPLSFGKIVVTDNSYVSSLQITVDGGCYRTGTIQIVEQCSPAEIYFYNFPAYTQLFFTSIISNTDLLSPNLNAAKFKLTEIKLESHKVTDANGEVFLKMGGTLKTSGIGKNYTDSDYQGYYRISVYYY